MQPIVRLTGSCKDHVTQPTIKKFINVRWYYGSEDGTDRQMV